MARGRFVAANALRRRHEKQRKQFIDELSLVLRRGLMLGIPPAELRELFEQGLTTAAESTPMPAAPANVS
jgi:hypothetical protein